MVNNIVRKVREPVDVICEGFNRSILQSLTRISNHLDRYRCYCHSSSPPSMRAKDERLFDLTRGAVLQHPFHFAVLIVLDEFNSIVGTIKVCAIQPLM